MRDRRADEARDERAFCDLVDAIQLAQLARADLSGRGRLRRVERAVGEVSAARGGEDARQQTGLAHRDGDHPTARTPREFEQAKDGDAVRDVSGPSRDLEDVRGRARHPLEEGAEVCGRAAEVVV